MDPSPAEDGKTRSGKKAALILKIILAYGIAFTILLLVFVSDPGTDPNDRAIILMGVFALWICWIGVCGTIMYTYREKIRNYIGMTPDSWMLKFVLLATALALLSEVFTVTATNLYWLFGGEYGKAFITASDNYFETVLLASVVVIWPAFVFWAWWLKRYDFHPNWVFLLYGTWGLIGEAMSFGLHQLFVPGMWIFTYGLMIYVPAYCVPENRPTNRPRWYHYALTLILPLLFQLPMIIGVLLFRSAVGHEFPLFPG